MSETAQRWQTYYDRHVERGEMDFLMSRSEADAYAFAACVVQWREMRLDKTSHNACVHCGASEAVGKPLVPYGGKAWLHPACWPVWYAARGERADVELNGMIQRVV